MKVKQKPIKNFKILQLFFSIYDEPTIFFFFFASVLSLLTIKKSISILWSLWSKNPIYNFKFTCHVQQKHRFMSGRYRQLSFICEQVMCSVGYPC